MLLAHKTNIKKLAIVLISSGLLAACNHTGSSSSSTSANATQHAAVNEAEEAQKVLQVVNHSGSTIDHISIMSESGQVLFKSTTGLNCTNNQDCNVDLNGLITTEKMRAKLYNNKNQVISMTVLMDTTVYASDTIFGTQLFSQFIAYQKSHKHAVNAMNLLQSLTQLFSNTKVSANVFEELGAYYSQQLTQGKIHNEDEFYTHLNNDLASGKPLTVKVPVLTATKQLSETIIPCDHKIADSTTTIFKTIAPFANLVPTVGSAINGVFSGTAAIIQDLCPTEQFDFAGSFEAINLRLTEIQTQITALSVNVQELRDVDTETTLKTLMKEMSDIYTIEDNKYVTSYKSFLNLNKMENKSVALSLTEYVNSYGGLDNLDKNKNETLYKQLKSIETEKEILDKMNSPDRFVAFTSAIKNICANDSVISSDIIAKRNYCNMITLNIGAKNAAYIQMARLRMSDKIAALSTSKDPGKIALPPYGNVDSWDQAGLAMKDDFVKDLNEIDKFYKNTLIVPTAGLPEKLLNQLNGKNNPLECFESTPSGVKGLMEWHTMNTLENKGKYIVTNCYQDKNHVNQVKSRYYYEEPAKDGSTNGGNGDDVINVLGTLVGKNVGKRVAVSTIKDDPSTLSTWWGAIKISQLKDVKIGGDPYKVYGSTSWDQSSFIYEANQVGGYTISNDNYNNDGRRELRSLWVAHYWDSNVHKPADIQLWQDRDRVNTYYLLNKQSNDELIYNLWIPYSLDGNKVLRGQKNISLSTSTTVPLGLPVTLKDGTTQWVIFGLYHYNAINSNIPDYLTGEDMGVQCLSSRCNYWFDNDNQMSRINMLLDDGRKIMISFKWNNGHQGKTPTLYVDTEK